MLAYKPCPTVSFGECPPLAMSLITQSQNDWTDIDQLQKQAVSIYKAQQQAFDHNKCPASAS